MTAAAAFTKVLSEIAGEAAVREDAPLAPLTTFRVGGKADWLVDVTTVAQLLAVVTAAAGHRVPVTVLGGGSNVLISDSGLRGVVLRPRITDITQPDANTVRAGAGVTINGLVRWTIGRGLSALEAWAGTPGTVGGAIYGNAHYGGRNIGDLVRRVALIDRDGRLIEAAGGELEFAYDTSRLQRTREVLVWAEFGVGPGEPDRLREVARASLAHRKRTQPLDVPSAGCVFQNPDAGRDNMPEGVPASAGALVDRAGLKGHRIGGAMISTTHGNFIVNDRAARAADIRNLIDLARRTVAEKFGVTLRDEVVTLGEF
jgi:UDP-N-acetylmuramate dehydrogenase